MKKAPKARTTRRTSTTTSVPPIVAALLTLVDEEVTAADADEMGRALAAARLTLRDPLRGKLLGAGGGKDEVWRFIADEAARGAWKELHSKIEQLTRPEDSEFNAINGDFQNLYGGPAFAMGIAVAYVFLREGGRR